MPRLRKDMSVVIHSSVLPQPSYSAEMKQENRESMTDSSTPESSSSDRPAAKMTELLSNKTREWETVKKKEGPLRLLDLPVDILRLIVKEVCLGIQVDLVYQTTTC